MTSYEAVRRTRAVLTEHGLPDAAFEGDILVQEVMGVRQPVRTLPERTLTEAQQETLADMTRRRCCHEPLQYLCGAWEFYGLLFPWGRACSSHDRIRRCWWRRCSACAAAQLLPACWICAAEAAAFRRRLLSTCPA
ncbi:MAG: hypothetical protein ACLT2C_04695 [Ruminococcus sp.]